MLKQNDKLQLIANLSKDNGFGTLVAIYNDIEQKWYYYVGVFKPRNPSNHIHFNMIDGKCINYIFDNEYTYFTGDLIKNELISTKIEDLPKEIKEFDFKFVWYK